LAFSADGLRLACVIGARSIHVWDAMTGVLLRRIRHPQAQHLDSLQFSPTESSVLCVAGSDLQMHLWDINSGERIRSLRGHGIAVFAPDGRSIATMELKVGNLGQDPIRALRIVDAESGARRCRLVATEAELFSASFSVNPTPQTLNPEPQTTNPKLQTLNPKPQTPNNPKQGG